ncbi:MAG TPA: DUF3131 domain-containing protein [Candidatus Binatia bacterium]|nr:DUF3131 domain-containing protein [Candidatus Binatia bacterium]
MLISIFGFLPRGNNTPVKPLPTDIPVASPNDTATPRATSSPTIKPSDPFNPIRDLFNGIGNSIATAILPPRAPGTIESAGVMNSSIWRQVARNAWNYFQPGVGVKAETGLPGSGSGVPYFTDWDLGVYIQAVIDGNITGLISSDGPWGSSARLEKVVSWLETRELNSTTLYPYWFYTSDGTNYRENSDIARGPVDGVDTGRLFVALNNLRNFNTSLAPRINDIVLHQGPYHNRTDYSPLIQSIKADCQTSVSIYAYYVYSGYAAFWPELTSSTTQVLNNMRAAGNVTVDGVQLPKADLLGDPLICSVFETANNSQLSAIAHQFYLAHEGYYGDTGQYRAFSEGGSISTHWAYEYVVLDDGRTWTILDETFHDFQIYPMIYTKIAISFLALYNTTYAYNMVVYLEKTLPEPTNGYAEGVDEAGNQLYGVGLNTNAMIVESARYAIQNSP